LTTGPLTLDAQGDANAVFIFSIDGTLTAGAPSGAVTLINSAAAKNVYFRTGGTTVIEAGIVFKGNVFAWSQVNALTGAEITGRLFAVTDQVTLDANAVTKAP
jgi:trimeric autotransporter adhesin